MGDVGIALGLQESSLDTMQAEISFTGLTAIIFPWKLVVDPSFDVISEFPVNSGSTFVITEDCDPVFGELCKQRWDVFMTVNKVCDVVSSYDIVLTGEHIGNGLRSQLLYTIS